MANVSAQVTCEDSIEINVVVLDTSTTALKLQCNSAERDLLTPGGQWTKNGRPIEAHILMTLPFSEGKSREIEARCHTAFSRRVARDRFQIGMKYLDLDDESYTNLCEFISFAMNHQK